MRRFLLAGVVAIAAATFAFTPAALAVRPDCDETTALCTEVVDSIGYGGTYTGHDEPSLLFYSAQPGSGNSTLYRVQLPTDPKVMPNQAGTAGTWNFQLHPALWFGMALCDNQSAPEFTHAACTPDSDTNIFDGTDPAAADYIGKHPGTAFLELQFYPPGWAPWPPGISCDATKWCAAMAIFSLNLDQNTNTANNADCLGTVGLEPANFAFLTKSGVPHAPPGPLDLTDASFTPSAATDLFMGSGDVLTIDIHDGAAGLTAIVHDLTNGQTGSMTASAANGFAQINFDPTATTCSETPYTFPPMYSTASEHTRVPWAAHTYNVAFSDEIGHFEYCSAVTAEGGACTSNNESALDSDDVGSSARRLRPSSRSAAASAPITTSTGSPTRRYRPGLIRIEARTRSTTRARSCSRARSSTATRTTAGWRLRPTCRESKRPTSAETATGPPERAV